MKPCRKCAWACWKYGIEYRWVLEPWEEFPGYEIHLHQVKGKLLFGWKKVA